MPNLIDGVILLDKPKGLSSNVAMQKVKRLFQAQKAGHTGSLDPLASGMLPICLGQATKFSQFLLNADKAYLTTARLGLTTTTGDAEGEVVEQKAIPTLTEPELNKILQQFIGKILQIPPMYSALKHQGKPLYKLARKGIEIERPGREIHIFQLQLLKATSTTLELYVHCSKGTYIRTLVEDIGKALGCGAHVSVLRRVMVGSLPQEMMTLETIEAASLEERQANYLLPVDCLVKDLPTIFLSSEQALKLQQGQRLVAQEGPNRLVAFYTNEKGFIGVGQLENGQVIPSRMLATELIYIKKSFL